LEFLFSSPKVNLFKREPVWRSKILQVLSSEAEQSFVLFLDKSSKIFYYEVIIRRDIKMIDTASMSNKIMDFLSRDFAIIHGNFPGFYNAFFASSCQDFSLGIKDTSILFFQ